MRFYDIYGKELEDGDFIMPSPKLVFSKLCCCTIKDGNIYLCDLLNSVPIKLPPNDLKKVGEDEYSLAVLSFVKKKDWLTLVNRMFDKIESKAFQSVLDNADVPQEAVERWTM